MIIKVRYEETVERRHQVEIDEEEFLEWANEGAVAAGRSLYATAADAAPLLKEFLEAGGDHDWADPNSEGYDLELLEATL